MDEFEKDLMKSEDYFLNEFIQPPMGNPEEFDMISFTIGKRIKADELNDHFVSTYFLQAEKYTAGFIQRLLMHRTGYPYTQDAIVDIRVPWWLWNSHETMILDGMIPLTQVIVTRKIRLNSNESIDPTAFVNYFDIISYYSGINKETPWYNPKYIYKAEDFKESLVVPHNYKADLLVSLLTDKPIFPKYGIDYIFDSKIKRYTEISAKKAVSEITSKLISLRGDYNALNEGLTNLYLHGQCIRFAAIFKLTLGINAIPLWMTHRDNPKDEYDHVFTYYLGRFYDASGSYTWDQLRAKWIVLFDKTIEQMKAGDTNEIDILHFSNGHLTKSGVIETMFGKEKLTNETNKSID